MPIDGSCHKGLKKGEICEYCETEVGGEFDPLVAKKAPVVVKKAPVKKKKKK